jgi:ubiquinone/menaquinone biosynthesis C-methylase UbiE
MHRVDYDRIAHLYDEPFRDHVVDPHLIEFLESVDDETAARLRVLDVGCGTGLQIAANRQRMPDVDFVGVDRFQAMLRIARARCPDAWWLQGDGAALPLGPQTCHYATSQFAYPHVRNPPALIADVFRVLRPGGRFVMTNIDPWSMPGWSIYRYFPEALALDRQDFVPVETFVTLLEGAGFQGVRVTRHDLSRRERVDDFLAFASKRHRASQLLAIPDAAYAAGLERLRKAVHEAAGDEPIVESTFVLVTIVADTPRSPSTGSVEV